MTIKDRLSAAIKKYSGFTLVELIVVITILAILATIGFLALSGYSSDARDSVLKANVRSVYSAISSESALTGNSPRYYIVHDAGAALTGAFVYVDGTATALTGGAWDAAGTNYSVGNPDYAKLKLNADKFKVASSGVFGKLPGFLSEASAAYDPAGQLSVGAMDWSSSVTATGRRRSSSFFQVAGTNPSTKAVTVLGNYPGTSLSGSVAGLVKDPSSASSTGALVDAGTSNASSSSGGGGASKYPGCDTDDVTLANGQVWAMCNVGASNAWTGGVTIANCSAGATDCDSAIRNTLGSYFQWGRNKDVTAGTVTAGPVASDSTPDFIKNALGGAAPGANYDWLTDAAQNDNLWGGGSTSLGAGYFTGQTVGNQTAMAGPCAAGYHVPTQAEWGTAVSNVTGFAMNSTVTDQAKRDLFVSTLKLPLAGVRNHSSAYNNQGSSGNYWASSPTGTNGYIVTLSATQVYPANINIRALGFSVRCLKN